MSKENNKVDDSNEFKPKTEEELTSEVIEDLKGDADEFDEEENADLIKRITQRRLKDEEFKTSKHEQATKRKETITKLETKLSKLEKPDDKKTPTVDEDAITAKIKQELKEAKDEEALEDADLSDEIKEKAKQLAKLNGISVKKAFEDDYIKSLIEKEEEAKTTDDASITIKNKARAKKSYENKKPSDYDVTTEEGREEYEKYKQAVGLK